uniref:Uncharacterized protein n=1 Tax=Zosterops lateralis melanops TaxID=1220523 RepID=A0A8D2QSG5_ZOSLA
MASCSTKRVKLHQIGVKVVTEVEAIIFYLVLSKGSNKNAQKMWEITFKEIYELPVGFDLPLARVSCILPPVSLYSLMCPHSSALIHSIRGFFNDHLKGTSNFHCEQSQIFRMLVHMIRARKILLIGKLKGYSVLAIAEALPEDGKIFACAEAPYLGANSQEKSDDSSDGKKIRMRVGPVADTLEALHAEDEHFDIVFIDADQRNAVQYYSFVMDNHLLSMDGVICVENTLMKGQVYLENVSDENVLAVRKLNSVINSDPRVEQVSAMPLVKVLTVLYLWILQSTL